jgi:hypothetical protein
VILSTQIKSFTIIIPWPENVNEKQTKAVEKAVESVLSARKEFPSYSLRIYTTH